MNGPLGAIRDTAQMGTIAACIVNANRKDKRKTFSLWDVLPFKVFGMGRSKAQTEEEMIAVFKGVAARKAKGRGSGK